MSAGVRIDTAEIAHLANMIGAAGEQAPVALARGLNATGNKALTQMRRAMAKQTGLKYSVMVRALKPKRASYGDLSYTIKVRGGNVRLKFFRPREVKGGVAATVKGQRVFRAGAFITSGRKPNRRRVGSLNGGVFENVQGGKWTGRIKVAKSGVFLPAEMVSGESEAAFYRVVQQELPAQLSKALAAIFSGAAPKGRLGRGHQASG